MGLYPPSFLACLAWQGLLQHNVGPQAPQLMQSQQGSGKATFEFWMSRGGTDLQWCIIQTDFSNEKTDYKAQMSISGS